MSSSRLTPDKHDPESTDSACNATLENVAGYVLDALDSFERGIVEHHIRWCAACRAEVERYEHVIGAMPFATAMVEVPSPSLKPALMARVSSGADPIRPTASSTEHAEVPSSRASYPEHPVWLRHLSTVLVGPLLLAVVVMGVWANSLRTNLDQRNTEYASQVQINEALSNGGQVQLYSFEQSCPTCNGSGQLGVSESNGMGMVVGWDFDPDQLHDVWGVNNRGERKKVCQLHVNPSGDVMQMFNFPEETSLLTDIYITDAAGELIYFSHIKPEGENDGTPIVPST